MTFDEAHHVERRAVDGLVGAEAKCRRHGHRRVLQRGDDTMLAAHVVCTGQAVAEWRPAEDQRRVVSADDAGRQVGGSAGDHLERERPASPGHMVLQPRRDRCDVDAWHLVHAARTVSRYRSLMAIDVTDATFQTEVVDRSNTAAVVVDLWAPWCGPCRTIGPILEKVTDATNGEVVLVKVNVDENPGVSQAFQVKSIPAVYAMRNGEVVDGFVGAHPEHVIEEFVANLRPSEEDNLLAKLIEAGDESSLREALLIEPGNEEAVIKLAELLVATDRNEDALAMLARIPESERTRKVAASARVSVAPDDDYDAKLVEL